MCRRWRNSRRGTPRRFVCFGPHASCTPQASMERAPEVDAMLVGEPEDGLMALATLDSTALAAIANLTFRRDGAIVPHRAQGSFTGFLDAPYPAWDLLDVRRYRVPLADEPYVIVETRAAARTPATSASRPSIRATSSARRAPRRLWTRSSAGTDTFGLKYFYLWGDTVTLNVKTFGAFCEELIARQLPIHWFGNARADNLTDAAFVAAPEAVGLLDAGARHRDGVGRDAQGHDEASRGTRRSARRIVEHAHRPASSRSRSSSSAIRARRRRTSSGRLTTRST